MKRLAVMILLVAAPAASAGDRIFGGWSGPGRVDRWPCVIEARYEASLCPPEIMARILRQQSALNDANTSVRLQPYTPRPVEAPIPPPVAR